MNTNVVIYYIGALIGFFSGMFVVYIGYVHNNILIKEKDHICIGAEPLDKDPSIVACTVFLRKGSEPYNEYLKLNPQSTN